jgi:type IV secretion system protein VirD4
MHIPPSDSDRLKPLVKMLISHLLDELMTFEHSDRDGVAKHFPLLWMLDEFYRLGRIDAIEGAIADMRSYGMRAFLILQSPSQIPRLYGHENSIPDSCRLVALRQDGDKACRLISDMLGDAEEQRWARTQSFGAMGEGRGRSKSEHRAWRRLMQPAEVSRMPKDRLLIFGEEKPIKAWRTAHRLWAQEAQQPLPDELRPGGVWFDLPASDPKERNPWLGVQLGPPPTVPVEMPLPKKPTAKKATPKKPARKAEKTEPIVPADWKPPPPDDAAQPARRRP